MDIETAVRNAYHSACAKEDTDAPTLREVWFWLPAIPAGRIKEVCGALGLPLEG